MLEINICQKKIPRQKRVCDMLTRASMRRENHCFVSLYFVTAWKRQNKHFNSILEPYRTNISSKCHLDPFNPLIPKSDWHLISPFKIIHESNIKVMRIKEMIINWRTSWLLNKFSLPTHWEMYRELYGEHAYWS